MCFPQALGEHPMQCICEAHRHCCRLQWLGGTPILCMCCFCCCSPRASEPQSGMTRACLPAFCIGDTCGSAGQLKKHTFTYTHASLTALLGWFASGSKYNVCSGGGRCMMRMLLAVAGGHYAGPEQLWGFVTENLLEGCQRKGCFSQPGSWLLLSANKGEPQYAGFLVPVIGRV